LQSKPSDEPSDGPIADLDTTEIIELTVPADMALTKVNDQEALWMRVRLVSGSFGFSNEVTWHDVSINRYTYLVTQPPSVAAFRLGYVWEDGPHAPEQVWTYNDFQYADRTYEATWPGKTFPAFERVQDLTPALYLGFDKKLPVDRLSLFLDVIEQRGDTRGPEMVWEYWNGANWRELSLEDETQRLRVPGMLSFIGAEDSQARPRFGSERHWLRGRLKEDGPPGEPQCAGIHPNSVWASDARRQYRPTESALQVFPNSRVGRRADRSPGTARAAGQCRMADPGPPNRAGQSTADCRSGRIARP
jgi:hypothetical protein